MNCWAKVVCAALLTLSSWGEAGVPKFEKGDRVAFIGDSITHGGSYHPNMVLFYVTRFPSAPFAVYNCGISGDTAPGTNLRFEQDIQVHRPNRATIMLGMNDAWTWLFNLEEPKKSEQQKNAYTAYTSEMDALAARLQGMGCDIIFIKPSIYDQTAELPKENLVGKNDLLGRFSEYIDELAVKYSGTVVDFRTPMMLVNEKLQAEDPTATVVGADRVHPGVAGHFVMSYAFLKAQEMPGLVSAIALDGADSTKVAQKNCSIRDVSVSSERVSFSCVENALPFPVSDWQKEALEWVPFQQELNRQLFQVRNLQPGSYELKIDGRAVGSWTAEQLAKGIGLAGNSLTPQYAHALDVKAVNDERLQVVDKLRSIMLVRHKIIQNIEPPVDENNAEQIAAALNAYLETSTGKPWEAYHTQEISKYNTHVSREQELFKEAEMLMKKMWQVAQPRSHSWELVKVE